MSFVPLVSVADVQLGKMLSPKAKTGSSYYPYLRNTNVQWGRIDISDLAQMDFSDAEREKFELRFGDLLVCEGGEPGRCALWRNEVRGCYYQKALHRVRAHEGKADSEFLGFWIRHQSITGAFEDQNAKTTIAHLPQVRLELLLVPEFGVGEQRRIAARLKAQLAEVETARQASRKQWREVQSLKSKALETVFGSVGNWQPIGSVAKLQSGYAFKSDAFKPSGVRLLRNTNILPGKVYWDHAVHLSEVDALKFPTYELAAGDVLLSLDRPVISSGVKVARVRDTDLPALLLQRVGRFQLDATRLDADYLFAFLQTDRFIAEISGHVQSLGVPHISPAQVEAVAIPLPDAETQKQLAQHLTRITDAWSAAGAALQRQLDDLELLPQRLLAQAFEAAA